MQHLILKFSEEVILSVSKTSLIIGREYVSELTTFGINNNYLNYFEVKITFAEDLFNEDKERLELKILTEIKNEALEKCFQWCRDVSLRIELAKGKKSKEYRTFPSKLLLDAYNSEKKMSPLMETIIKLAEENNEALSSVGQTPEILEAGHNLLDELRTADSNQGLKKIHKKKATQIRHEKFNELYDIVNMINKVARNLFREDMPKYVLFESPWRRSKSGSSEVFKGEIAAGESKLITEVKDVDSLIFIENTGTADLQFYAGNKTPEMPELILSAGEEATILLSEIGDGKTISIENLDTRTVGEYRVEI